MPHRRHSQAKPPAKNVKRLAKVSFLAFFSDSREKNKKFKQKPLTIFYKHLYLAHTKRPYRLVAQDSGFSFPQQRFETAWGYKKDLSKDKFFFYTHKPTATKGIKKFSESWTFFVTAPSGIKRTQRKLGSFLYPRANRVKGYKNPASPINGKSPSIGGRQYFTSWNERLLNKLLIHQNRFYGSYCLSLFR